METDAKQRQAELLVAVVDGGEGSVKTVERLLDEGVDLRWSSEQGAFSDDMEQYPGFEEARNKFIQHWYAMFNAVWQLEDGPVKSQALDALASQFCFMFGFKRRPKDCTDQ